LGGEGGQEKTEKATPKKRKDAREKEGNVLQSKEINTTMEIAFTFFAMFLLGNFMFQQLMNMTHDWLGIVTSEFEMNGEFISHMGRSIAMFILITVGPLIAVGFVVPVVSSIFQTRGLFTMKPLKPKFSKLNPIKGMKKLVSLQSLVKVVKGLIVIAAVLAIVFTRVFNRMNEYFDLVDSEIRQGIRYTASEILSIVILIVLVIIFVSALDYIFQWWQYEKKLKMSKQEVKDEFKQMDGDPLIKSKIKQKQREVAQHRMMEQVPKSDVVVRNPTHYAVAISYNRENTLSAPTVTAKGKDSLALKIIELAEEHEVFISENRPLARELYDTVEVGQEIPPSLYNAIAIILTDMYTAKGITLDS
jgi:flagellar biosynthetic protein FlhB